jgi:hypothetical protein
MKKSETETSGTGGTGRPRVCFGLSLEREPGRIPRDAVRPDASRGVARRRVARRLRRARRLRGVARRRHTRGAAFGANIANIGSGIRNACAHRLCFSRSRRPGTAASRRAATRPTSWLSPTTGGRSSRRTTARSSRRGRWRVTMNLRENRVESPKKQKTQKTQRRKKKKTRFGSFVSSLAFARGLVLDTRDVARRRRARLRRGARRG